MLNFLDFLHKPEKLVDFDNPYKEPVVEKHSTIAPIKSAWIGRNGDLWYLGRKGVSVAVWTMSAIVACGYLFALVIVL